MKNQSVSHVGKELSFDERGYNKSVGLYKEILPLINNLSHCFEALGLGAFRQDSYDKLLRGDYAMLKTDYDKKLDAYIASLKLPIPSMSRELVSKAEADFTAMLQLVTTIKNELSTRKYSGIGQNADTYVFLEKIVIADGRAVLTDTMLDDIKKYYTDWITTDHQADVYQCFLELKAIWDKMSDTMKKAGDACNIITYSSSNDSLVWVDDEDHLQLFGQAMRLVK